MIVQASCLLVFALLLFIGSAGLLCVIRRYTPHTAIRGVQLSTGVLLLTQEVKLIKSSSMFQQIHSGVEPYLRMQYLDPLPIWIVLGLPLVILTIFLLDNKRIPAASALPELLLSRLSNGRGSQFENKRTLSLLHITHVLS